jgi:hypothetical protein
MDGTGKVKSLGVPGHIVLHADGFMLTIMDAFLLPTGLGAGIQLPTALAKIRGNPVDGCAYEPFNE